MTAAVEHFLFARDGKCLAKQGGNKELSPMDCFLCTSEGSCSFRIANRQSQAWEDGCDL